MHRVALVADGLGATSTLEQIRERGVPGFAVEVIGSDALAGGAFDLLHVCSPGAAGVAAVSTARARGLPVAGSFHTEPAQRSGDALIEAGVRTVLSTFYGGCDVVLSPSRFADTRLHEIGIDSMRVVRWDPGVDRERFSPGSRRPRATTFASCMPAGSHARRAPTCWSTAS